MRAKIDYDSWDYPRALHQNDGPLDYRCLLNTGIHSFDHGADLTLDFLSIGFDSSLKSPGHFLVAFQGAVSDKMRAKSAAPFFCGVGLSTSLNIPLLTVSDPSLVLNEKLTLGWYAGNQYMPDVHGLVAGAIDSLAERTGRYPVIIGGSGGGFAAIQTMSRMKTPATCIAWNPQTTISNYFFDQSYQYLKIAHPNIAKQIKGEITSAELTALLDQTLPGHRLANAAHIQAHHQVVYLQNCRDPHHMTRHAGPWLKDTRFAPINGTSYISERGNILFFPGDWGNGHIPPKLDLLKKLVTSTGAKNNIAYVAASLLSNDDHAAKRPLPWLAAVPPGPGQISMQCERTDSGVDATVTIGSKYGRSDDFSYAFYLYADGKKVDARGYNKSATVNFDGARRGSALSVVAYLRDQLGSVQSITRKISAVVAAWAAAIISMAGQFADEAEAIIEQSQLFL